MGIVKNSQQLFTSLSNHFIWTYPHYEIRIYLNTSFFLNYFLTLQSSHADASFLKSGWVGTDIYKERRLLDVLSLAHQNFATFDHRQYKATVGVCGICLYS